MLAFSKDLPLIHQIAFQDKSQDYRPNRNSRDLKTQFGEQNYRIWLLDETRSFLRMHYSIEVLKAFDSLVPYAYKADLARYCILNQFGGTYLDLSINNVRTYNLEQYDMMLFRDLNSSKTSWKVCNNIFYSRPRNKVLDDAISECVKNISNSYYGHDPHFPTGPSVLGRSVAKNGFELNLLMGQCYWFKRRKLKFVVSEDFIIARGKIGGKFLGGNSGLNGGNNYNELWKSRSVYGENR